MRRGFTIIELMIVIGIIGILMGIVFTAASSSVRAGRSTRADALCQTVQSGLATYYAQYEKWPGGLGSKIENGSIRSRSNDEGRNNQSDDDLYVLTASEVRECVRKIVESAKEGNPLIDVSGLWVSRGDGESGGAGEGGANGGSSRRGVGMDFMTAIHGSRRNSKKMKLNEMYFGYPDESSGAFVRFGMGYSIPTDQMTVGKRSDYRGREK